jgi:hypothetical protein
MPEKIVNNQNPLKFPFPVIGWKKPSRYTPSPILIYHQLILKMMDMWINRSEAPVSAEPIDPANSFKACNLRWSIVIGGKWSI